MSNEKSTLDAMLAQYETATLDTNENTFDVKNYFTTYLKDGENSATMNIRILPSEGSPFKEVFVHSAKVDGKNRKFTCIKELNDEACPFCEVKEELLASGDEAEKELAKNYKARKMYVVKVIDRDNESDGPKFWRFPINYKKDGILDKIMAIVRNLKQKDPSQANITDAQTGRDLTLNIVRVKNPRGGTYPAVNTIMQDDKSPLSSDPLLAKEWMENTKTWKDVYSVKPYDYLLLVVKGKTPVWDKVKEKFVAKEDIDETNENPSDDLDSQISMGASAKTSDISEKHDAELAETSYDIEEDSTDDDDLPF